MSYRPDIDGLRALAIICVFLFHLKITGFAGGFVGVDVFFVISGFLITRLIRHEFETQGAFNFKRFYLRRISRLLPAFFVTLLLTTIAAILMFSPTHLSAFGGALTSSIFSVSNFYFWSEANYFDVSSDLKPLLHTWSLSIEEQFYLLWPITFLLISRLRIASALPVFLAATIFISLILNFLLEMDVLGSSESGIAIIKSISDDKGAAEFFLLPFRIYEFSIGGLLVWLVKYNNIRKLYFNVFFGAGLLLILYSAVAFNEKMLFPSYFALLPTLGAAMVIYAGSGSHMSVIFTNRLMVWIGLLSYSLYLVHWPIIVFWQYIFGDLKVSGIVGVVCISVLLAYLMYRYVETPFRRTLFVNAASPAKIILFSGVALLCCMGVSMKLSGGWAWRSPPPPVVFEQSDSSENFHKVFYGGADYFGLINTKEAADIVLVGDSHGAMYAEGIYKVLAEKKHLSLFVSDRWSVIKLPGFIRPELNNDANSAVSFAIGMDAINESRKSGKRPVVIISHAWVIQMERADLIDDQGNRKNIKITNEVVLDGLLLFKRMIGDCKLVVIGGVPEIKENLYDVFTRPRANLFSRFDAESHLYFKSSEEILDFNRYMRDTAISTGEFIFLDPHDALCRDNICRAVDAQRRLIYSDASHLSKYGSLDVINYFAGDLLKVIDESRTH